MRNVTEQRSLGLSRWLALRLTPLALACATPLKAQVIWEPVTEKQAQQDMILVPMPSGSRIEPLLPQPIVWEPVPSKETNTPEETNAIVWTLVPGSESVAEGSAPSNTVVWEVIPETDTPLSPAPSNTLAQGGRGSSANAQEGPPAEVIAQEATMPPRLVPGPPPPPPIQALNRSVAFGDGLVGPDISLRIPNGFRWSQRWFGDVSILGYDYQNGRNPGDPFIPAGDSGNLDGWGIIHTNILQTKNWSFALNTSFRSLQNNPDIPGGSTGIEDGVSSGFRIARAIGDTGGIAFGGEQVIQWDDNTDTGRNLYLMASNGWWLGNNGKDYPLFIANGGFGTGRFASLTDKDEPFNFTCTPVESNRKVGKVDENLCWGPIGSVSLVFDEWWGTFVEYAIGRATLGISANLTGGIPLRVTAGVHFAENDEIVSFDELRWITQFSIGF